MPRHPLHLAPPAPRRTAPSRWRIQEHLLASPAALNGAGVTRSCPPTTGARDAPPPPPPRDGPTAAVATTGGTVPRPTVVSRCYNVRCRGSAGDPGGGSLVHKRYFRHPVGDRRRRGGEAGRWLSMLHSFARSWRYSPLETAAAAAAGRWLRRRRKRRRRWRQRRVRATGAGGLVGSGLGGACSAWAATGTAVRQ